MKICKTEKKSFLGPGQTKHSEFKIQRKVRELNQYDQLHRVICRKTFWFRKAANFQSDF